jgi:hypothetical protein
VCFSNKGLVSAGVTSTLIRTIAFVAVRNELDGCDECLHILSHTAVISPPREWSISQTRGTVLLCLPSNGVACPRPRYRQHGRAYKD